MVKDGCNGIGTDLILNKSENLSTAGCLCPGPLGLLELRIKEQNDLGAQLVFVQHLDKLFKRTPSVQSVIAIWI